MIQKIEIRNFKSLRNIKLNLNKINVLFGLNGMGKSSFIQVFLLLKQSFEQSLLPNDGLSLNGPILNLGIGKDVFCDSGDDLEGIQFILSTDSNTYNFTFDYSPKLRSANVLPLKSDDSQNNDSFENRIPIGYISTNRIPPKTFFELSDFQVNRKNNIGKQGEYVAHYLTLNSSKKIPESRRHKDAEGNRLLENLQLWLSEISPSVQIEANTDFDANIAKIRYSYKGNGFKTKKFKPLNVGFGLTHVLPIIVELLISEENTILILENPESHIHPKGQDALTDLITSVVQDNIQVIIESHSNEIIEGITKYSNNKEIDYSLNHFYRSYAEHVTVVDSHFSLKEFRSITNNFFSPSQLDIYEKLESYQKPMIITEGKTDWKILKYVLAYLKENGSFEELKIEFYEFEHKMGVTELKRIKNYIGGINNVNKVLLLYDRDECSFRKDNIPYEQITPNCFQVILPIPKFRKGDENICIELLFPNELLTSNGKDGKRLFLSSEFSGIGRLKSDNGITIHNASMIENCLSEEKEKIIDGNSGKVYSREGESLAITKNKFVERLIDNQYDLSGIDLSAFIELFKEIERIYNLPNG